MTSWLANLLGPIALWAFKSWIESRELSKEQQRSYYEFMETIDKGTKVDVANYIAAGDARQATIDRIKAKRESGKNK